MYYTKLAARSQRNSECFDTEITRINTVFLATDCADDTDLVGNIRHTLSQRQMTNSIRANK